jgi:hypothetical protein
VSVSVCDDLGSKNKLAGMGTSAQVHHLASLVPLELTRGIVKGVKEAP